MIAPRFGLLALLLLFAFGGSAQVFVIRGYVLNHEQQPVSRAAVTLENLQTTTNAEGYFELSTEFLPNVLDIRHDGYDHREYFVNMPPIGQDTVAVTIELDDKGTDLEEFTVSASRVIWAYPKANVHVIDFELYKEGMLLLCKDRNEYLLRIVNAASEPIFDLPVRRHPKSFFKDCTGRMHIVYPDSAYEVSIYHDSVLTLLPPLTTSAFRKKILPCCIATGDLRIYQYPGDLAQSTKFVKLDTLTLQTSPFYAASNRKYLRALAEYQYDLAQQEKTVSYRIVDASEEQLSLAELERKQREMVNLLAKPVYTPAFLLRDSIVIFDHLNDSAVVFNSSGQYVRRFPVIYQHHRKWSNELIPNDEGTRVFARYDYNGMARLQEIDVTTGAIIREVPIDAHIYPTKIEVRGNFVYYIYHYYIDNSINYVYKQRIE